MKQQKLELTIRHEQDFSPWFNVVDYRPTIVGPYAHQRVTEDGRIVECGMHWWNGEEWSAKLDYDPDIDDAMVAPPANHYPKYIDEAEWRAINIGVQWRGFNSNQEPDMLTVVSCDDDFDVVRKMIAAEPEDEF